MPEIWCSVFSWVYFFLLKLLLTNTAQVLDPSDRIGVPPKSSTSELRDHSFFIGPGSSKSEDHRTSYINWDTLWSDPPAVIEPGLVRVIQRERQEEDARLLAWNDFVQDFSLVLDDNPRTPSPPNQEEQGGQTRDTQTKDTPTKDAPTSASPTNDSPTKDFPPHRKKLNFGFFGRRK